MRSVMIGLRLWGIALEPFCAPARNGSSASRTSVRCRWADLRGQTLEPGPGQRDRLQDLRVAVARDHLRGDVLGLEPEPAQDAAPRSRDSWPSRSRPPR
jgi:hypothetical protein